MDMEQSEDLSRQTLDEISPLVCQYLPRCALSGGKFYQFICHMLHIDGSEGYSTRVVSCVVTHNNNVLVFGLAMR